MASDCGISFVAGVANDLFWGAVREARYCYKFNTLVTDLGSEEDKLKKTTESWLVQVRKAKANTEEPSEDLEPQLEKANKVKEKVDELKRKAAASKSSCCGVCPNCICRYILGKKAATITTKVRQLNEGFASRLKFARRLSLRPIGVPNNFILFDCTRKAKDELFMALINDNTVTIGLHGMGGCGKSSLLKLLHKALKDDQIKLFDTVAYVKLSNPPNILAIQDSIASWLGLKLTEKDETVRAARLSMRLKDGGKFLIILDDVWEELKLENIGIPVGENCKVLISSRQQQLCNLMDCQKLIHLSLPTREEAWDLFQKYAGVVQDGVKSTAQEIAGKCGRLPIALKAVASSLKGQLAAAWEDALQELREGEPLTTGTVDDPYLCLKSSFDRLEDEEKRSLFLLCALFPEDSEIASEILIRFAFGLGIFENVKSYKRARTKVVAAIDKITDYSLLQAEEGQCVKMHGLMRDMALAVAEKNTRVIEGPRQNLGDLRENFMEDITRLSCHDIYEFPDDLNCPKLEILFLSNDGGYSSKFPNTFFRETKELKVLAIQNTSIWTNPDLPLPRSMEGLRKLQTLCLTGWTVGNISVLGELGGLHTIQLLYCTMSELPRELAEMGKLKLLQASWCSIGGSPYEVLIRCLRSGLEELYFVGNEQKGGVSDPDVEKLLCQVAYSTELQRYHLEIGSSKDTFIDDSTSKYLSINGFDASTIDKAVKDLAQKLEVLFLTNIHGRSKNIIPGMIRTGGGCMNELTEFVLRKSYSIEYLIDTTSCQVTTVFSKLLKLKIETMDFLKALCRGPPPSGFLEKLEELFIMECSGLQCIVSMSKLNLCSLKSLELEACSNITSFFTTATAQTMVMLEVLNVRHCDALKHIIKDEDDIISLQPVFPKLKQVNVKKCKRLECIIPASFAGGLLQLESLQIEDADELKHVFGKYKLKEEQKQNRSIDLPRLKVFKLIKLPNIVSFCPPNYQITCLSLDEPYIMACPQLSRKFLKQLNEANAVKQVVQVEKLEEKAITTTSSRFENWIYQCCLGKKKEKKTKQTMTDHVVRSPVTLMPISEDRPQENKTPALEAHEEHGETSGSKEEADGEEAVAAEEEDHNDKEDKDGTEVRKKSNAIEQSTTSYMDKGKDVAANPSLDLQFEVQAAAEIDQQTQEFDSTFDNHKGHQGQNFDPVGSKDLRENDTKIVKESVHKDLIPEEYNLSPKQDDSVAGVHLQTQELDSVVDTQEDLQAQKFYPELIEKQPQVVSVTETKQALQEYQVSVPPSTSITAATPGALTSFTALQYESPEIANGSVHKDDPAPQESKLATSSLDLIKRMPQLELERPQIVKHPQQALEEYKGALTLSSKKQHLSAEEMIDFHSLFRISEESACLLDEAFAKYPHLWNWHISQKTPRLCEWGYNCLAELLAFLKSVTPNSMDDSKRKKFGDLYGELETFGFDKEWLASIRQRVMEMQTDQLKFEANTLQHILNIIKARMASIEVDLSKLDIVFGL